MADSPVPPIDEPPEMIDNQGTEAAPRTIRGILSRLGPGLIIAGAIVGSGELIATTKTGAEAGFFLLWLIIIGCVIKVFTQVEMGRYTISSGTTAMAAMNEVPGPRLRVNWMLWYWLAMFIVGLGQLGGIIDAVGQTLAMNLPIDNSFNASLWDDDEATHREQIEAEYADALGSSDTATESATREQVELLVAQRMDGPRPETQAAPGGRITDKVYWSALATFVTIGILLVGRYAVIQNVSAVLVAMFTLVTIFTVVALAWYPQWAITWADLGQGLSFRLPPVVESITRSPLATALATFGIIGVGTNELIAYPYWCQEKGYGRFTGPRDSSTDWADRAEGWMRVLRWDVFLSMVVYTFATVAFYLLGAAVLHRQGLNPADKELIQVLGQMYVPVFGDWARWLFLFGAFAVLYSTFFIANACHTRVASDAVRIFGLGARTDRTRRWWISAFCVILPMFALVTSVLIPKPAMLILASGVMQTIMLPMLAGAALYYRYRRCDARITPGRTWDLLLWGSALVMLIAAIGIVLLKLFPSLGQLG